MQNKHLTENTPATEYNARQIGPFASIQTANHAVAPTSIHLPTPTPTYAPGTAPRSGERAADLIYSDAEKDLGGIWIYPAYDDFWLAYRRANSLTRGFGVPFGVDLLRPHANDEAVSEPGYYAFTRADPRPHVISIAPRPFVLPVDLSNGEDGGR